MTTTERRLPTTEDFELAKKALARVEAELEGKELLNDYEHNLNVVIRSGVVDFRTAGIAASLMPYFSRLMSEEIRRAHQAKTAANSTHVGTVGKRAVFKGLLLEAVISIETQYGALNIHKFLDADGNVIVWKTGSANLDKGLIYDLKATVKEHSDYKGCKQTLLTRAVVEDTKDPVPA